MDQHQLDRIERLLNELVRESRERRVERETHRFEDSMRGSIMSDEGRANAHRRFQERIQAIKEGLLVE